MSMLAKRKSKIETKINKLRNKRMHGKKQHELNYTDITEEQTTKIVQSSEIDTLNS